MIQARYLFMSTAIIDSMAKETIGIPSDDAIFAYKAESSILRGPRKT